MRVRRVVAVIAAVAAVALAGCAARSSQKPPAPARPHQSLARRQAKSCVAALAQHKIAGAEVTVQGPWPRVTLSSSLTGGPIAVASASAVETATWNVLSQDAGLPLTAYLGKTVSAVAASYPPQNSATCLELGSDVVGLYASASAPGAPMGDVSLQGLTVSQITGLDYLAWLERIGAYVPHPVPNSASMSAGAVLLDYFDAINTGQTALEATLAQPNMRQQGLLALVPLSISRVTDMGSSVAMNPKLSQEFEVPLWPHFAGTPSAVGNGLTFMFYVVQRQAPDADWMVANAGTGP